VTKGKLRQVLINLLGTPSIHQRGVKSSSAAKMWPEFVDI